MKKEKKRVITVVVIVLLIVGLFIGFIIYSLFYTESGKRALKSTKSNWLGGINRTVSVYSQDGKLIKEYHGKFDVEYSDERILFDDENGLRHIIYFKSGQVIVDETGD